MAGSGTRNQLVDPGVCRVFFSSPFNGMEEEREELTRKYWPQLQSACGAAGVTFVPVDMRWGITSDQSSTAQTITICLQEIDRSDVFVGFFGQRYGWHGSDDTALQATFEAAMSRYPWLAKFRDRSVTELEFLHGHLNHPGKLPAVLCFRDKNFDDEMRAIGMKNDDKRQIYKYSAESDEAAEKMKDLMHRVKDSERQCLGVNMAYANPKEGAQWMFEKVWEYLKEVFKRSNENLLTKREQELHQHKMFLAKKNAQYRTTGKDIGEKLDRKLLEDDCHPLVIVGETGSGKSSLLCDWIQKHSINNQKQIWIYHFVGCTAQSSDPHNILRRVISTVRHEVNRSQMGTSYVEMDHQELDRKSRTELINECYLWMKKASDSDFKLILIVDGLQKIQYDSKITRPLFWLPKNLPKNVHVVLSTDVTDKAHTEEVEKERQGEIIEMEKLSTDVCVEICTDVLKLRGKTLSSNQLQQIVTSERASNPLFLKVVLEELCTFGKFRELDQKIESLVNSSSISDLFGKFLERLELDYDSSYANGSMTEIVMTALCVSRKGLTENELSHMFGIESHQWLPFYYALEPYLNRMEGGFLKIAHEPLITAVNDRYIATKERKKEFLQKQITHYKGCLDNMKRTETSVPDHVYTELLWLCHQAEDQALLRSLVMTIPIFLKLFHKEPYQLLAYVDSLRLSNDELILGFSRAVDLHVAGLYSERTEDDLIFDFNAGEEFVAVLEELALFLDMARLNAEEHFLIRLKEVLENNDRVKNRDVRLHVALYKLACHYVNIREAEKALPFHEQALAFFENKAPKSGENLQHLARSNHGTGTVYMKISRFDEAIKCFEKSMEIHKSLSHSRSQLSISQSLSCIAEVYSMQQNYKEACEKYEEVVAMENSIYTDYLPPEASYSRSNLGICYRRLKSFDKAKEVYQQALKIKLNALGENHVDVGYAYFSLGNLEFDRQNPNAALEHFERALEIFRKVNYLDSIDTVFIRENIAQVYMLQNDKDKGLPYYWDAFEYLEKHGQMAVGNGNIHLNYLRHLLALNDYSRTRRVSKAMIGCEQMQHFLPYLFLDYVNRSFLSIDPATEPYKESIERGIELFPDNINLPFQKIELNLVPNRNLDSINDTLEFYYKHATGNNESLVVEALKLCYKANWTEGARKISESWSRKRPEFKECLLNVTKEFEKEE